MVPKEVWIVLGAITVTALIVGLAAWGFKAYEKESAAAAQAEVERVEQGNASSKRPPPKVNPKRKRSQQSNCASRPSAKTMPHASALAFFRAAATDRATLRLSIALSLQSGLNIAG